MLPWDHFKKRIFIKILEPQNEKVYFKNKNQL